MSKKETLFAKIKEADHAYYDLDNPIMSDSDYDKLRQEYIDAYGSSDLDYVPGTTSSRFTKYQHSEPVISLSKVKASEGLKLLAAVRKLWPVIHEPKLDGLTVVAYPNADGSCQFVTRGDGKTGEVLPNFISKYEGSGVNNSGHPIRGEVFMRYSTFNEINKERIQQNLEPLKNPRNAAAGILRNKDRSPYIDRLEYLCYDVLGSNLKETDKLNTIKETTKFETVSWFAALCVEDEVFSVEDFVEKFKDPDIPIDGVVVKANQEDSIKKFGTTGHHNNNAFAYKPYAEDEETILRGVEWQVGRSRITPVAIVDPVVIDGSTVSKASLANPGVISKLGLKIGDTVTIIKANEIIPQIVNVVAHAEDATEIKIPDKCPSCDHALETRNDQLYCLNVVCPEKTVQNIVYLGSRKVLDIEGLSVETARKIVAKYKDSPEYAERVVFAMKINDIQDLPGFAKKSAEKLFTNIQQARFRTDLAHYVAACCVPTIGITIGTSLMRKYRNYDNLLEALSRKDVKEFLKLPNIGKGAAKILFSGYFMNKFRRLHEWIMPLEYEKEDNGKEQKETMTFVLTGKMENPRVYYEGLITKSGNIVGKTVTKNTDYLVMADPNSMSTKAIKARKTGVKLISPSELETLLAS